VEEEFQKSLRTAATDIDSIVLARTGGGFQVYIEAVALYL